MPESPVRGPAKGYREIWIDARQLYIEGEPGSTPEAPHIWPTLEVIAQRSGVRWDSLRKRAGKEGWRRERAMFVARLEREKRNAKLAKLTAESAQFDSTTFKLAQALAGEVAQQFRDINKVRQMRDMKAREAEGDDDKLMTALTEPKYRPATAHQLSALSTALATAQRIGRLALGEPTDAIAADVTAQVEMDIKGEMQVTTDYRTDPKMVAEVARILKEAGIDVV